MGQAMYQIGGHVLPVRRSGPVTLAAGNNTVVAALTGKRIRVLSAVINLTTAGATVFQSGAGGTALSATYTMAANLPLVLPRNENGWWETAAGSLLNCNVGGSGAGTVEVTYVELEAGIDHV